MRPFDIPLPSPLVATMGSGLPFPAPRSLTLPVSPVQDDDLDPALEALRQRLREAEATIASQRNRIDHLETLTMTDELTGLMNRRGFIQAFRRELAAAARRGHGGLLVMVDLNGFKMINDTHGHQCGDMYLRHVARALSDNVRAQDVVARLGGDEFAVLLTHVTPEQGQMRAAALAEQFHALSCPWMMEQLPLRASFGAQPFTGGDREDEVIRRADAAMYEMKKEAKAAR
ncbi:GGDEF domain-containing protein [Niveispirillum irakense]|uniref:GGDEF domain-containing protein n=1 Tax=Niveispirillum irakense TaxID=34011 RepID=UPI0004289E9D|nr:GGDEF domain-containing protein [Niveispirillum irakense]